MSRSSSSVPILRLCGLLRRYPLTLCCVALIWYLCLFKPPSVSALEGIVGFDKMVHVAMYLGTCGVMWWEYARCHRSSHGRRLVTWAIAAPIAMSGLIELVQEYLTTWRGGDLCDFAANTTGVLLAALGGSLYLRRRFRP